MRHDSVESIAGACQLQIRPRQCCVHKYPGIPVSLIALPFLRSFPDVPKPDRSDEGRIKLISGLNGTSLSVASG